MTTKTKTIYAVHDAILASSMGYPNAEALAALVDCTKGTARRWARELVRQGLVEETGGQYQPAPCSACKTEVARHATDGVVLCGPCDALRVKRSLEAHLGLPQGTLDGTDSTGAELVAQAEARAKQARVANWDVEGETREALAYTVLSYDKALAEFLANVAKHGPTYTIGWRAAALAQHETQAQYAKKALESEDVLAMLASMAEEITRKLLGCCYDESSTNAISNALTRAQGRGAARFLEQATFRLERAKQREEARLATK